MSVTLFDIQTGFGGGVPGEMTAVSAEELRAEMTCLEIARALVRITPESMEFDVPFCNARLFAACAADDAFIPCPIVVPNSGADLPPDEEQVDACIRQGSGAVWIRPGADGWLTADWCAGKLFHALEDRKLPVLCLERLLNHEQVADLARRYPALPLIIAESNYRMQRILLPLLEAHPNVHLSTGNNYIVYKGIEQFVERGLAERLLFGTGFPVSEAACAVTQLMYADISEDARRSIGAGNVQRLMEEIVR